jgi:hypothetical protein
MESLYVLIRLLSYSFLTVSLISIIWSLPFSLVNAAIAQIFRFGITSTSGMKMIKINYIIEGVICVIINYYIFSLFDKYSNKFNDYFYFFMILPLALFTVMPEENYRTQQKKSSVNFPNEYLRFKKDFRKIVFGFLTLLVLIVYLISFDFTNWTAPYIFQNIDRFSWWILLHCLLAFTHIQMAVKINRPIED